MVDVPPELVGAGTALTGAGWALKKVLGPTLDQVGKDLREQYSEYRQANVARIALAAANRLPDDVRPGQVPPRLAGVILDDGSWCNDEVMAEYFGGILAASRTEHGRDDRGAKWARVVAGMSSFEVRTHYLVYSVIRRELVGEDRNLGEQTVRRGATVWVPGHEYAEAMGFEEEQANEVAWHSLNGLIREKLLGPDFKLGEREYVGGNLPESAEWGFNVLPSLPGFELFNWAYGKGGAHINSLLDPDEPYPPLERIPLPPTAQVSQPRKADTSAQEGSAEHVD